MTTNCIDSSFFQDDDGTMYYVWMGGLIAKMSGDMVEFDGKERQLLTVDGERVGYEGAFIVKYRGKYILGCAEWNGDKRVDGTYDLMYGVAKTIDGPYSRRQYC